MTSFYTIEDLALIEMQDYRIDNLAATNTHSLEIYLDGLLVRAIPKFVQCLQPLTYSLQNREFDSDLTILEQEILAQFVAMSWMEQVINDITQMNAKLSNREYKTYSEAENLKQKSEYFDRMREKANQLAIDYQIQNLSSFF